MKLFDKRPLSLILCIFLVGLFLFSGFNLVTNVIIASLSLLFVILLIFLPKLFGKLKNILIASTVMLLLSSLFSLFYFNMYFDLYKKYDKDEILTIEGTIYEIKEHTNGYTITLDDIKINENSHSNKISCYIDKNECNILIRPLKTIKFAAQLEEYSSENSSTQLYYRANGLTTRAFNIKNLSETGEGEADLSYTIKTYRSRIANFIINSSDRDGGGLLAALLIGEREYISDSTHLAFERTGTLHILAISGMHLVLLMHAINSMLRILSINKKARKIIEIIICILYITLLGFPLSVCRAGIMLLISAILYLIASDSDSITSLFISVALICIVQPYSIYDLSLWLSAFATLGILVYSELVGKLKIKRKLYKILFGLISPIIISIFAISFTFIITIFSFNSISLIGPITTIILNMLIEYFMYAGLVFLIFAGSIGTGYLVSLYGNLIIKIVNSMSGINGVYVAADGVLIKILVALLSLLIILFLVLDIKKKKGFLLLLLTFFISISGIALTKDRIIKNEENIEYILSESCDYVLLKSQGKCILIDATKPSKDTSYSAIDAIYNFGLREIDAYVYINYSPTLPSSFLHLLSNINIKEFYLPTPNNNEESNICKEISKTKNIALSYYDMGDYIFFNNYTLMPYYREEHRNKSAYLIFDGNKTITYLSSGMLEGNTNAVAKTLINGSNTVIFARNGERYYNYIYNDVYTSIDRLIVSSKSFKISEYVLPYYEKIDIIDNTKKISIKH